MAFIPPKVTRLLAAEALKPVPLIVTVVPMEPLAGVKLVITGWAKHWKASVGTRMARIRDFLRKFKVDSLGLQTNEKKRDF